jgi:hypothetical protein
LILGEASPCKSLNLLDTKKLSKVFSILYLLLTLLWLMFN